MITIPDAIRKTMFVLDVSEEEAAKMIQKALNEGKLRSTFTRDDGTVEILPPNAWGKP